MEAREWIGADPIGQVRALFGCAELRCAVNTVNALKAGTACVHQICMLFCAVLCCSLSVCRFSLLKLHFLLHLFSGLCVCSVLCF